MSYNFKAKCTKFDFRCGSLQRSPDRLAVFKEVYFYGERGKGEKSEGEERERGGKRTAKGEKRRGQAPKYLA